MRTPQILGTRIELMARLGGVQRWWDLISVFVGLPVRPADTGGGNGGPIGYNFGSTARILTMSWRGATGQDTGQMSIANVTALLYGRGAEK